MRIVLSVALLLSVLGLPAVACGPDTDCMVGARHYRIALPESHGSTKDLPALVYVHGYKGTAQGVMRNASLRRLANDLGAALIAVQSDGPGWNVPNNPRDPNTDGAQELAYFDAVRADAVTRFGLDERQVVAAGFSSGGMMIWNLACARPQAYAGFLPVAGTFWRAPPAQCETPVASIVHIHGDADRVVPLLGRAIGPTRQGKVPAALEMYRRVGAFGPAQREVHGGLTCDQRVNAAGKILQYCQFVGGHAMRADHLRHGWAQLVKAGQL